MAAARRATSASGCELIVLALGKLGGREPNYHSDLDLVFLYEAEGTTVAARAARGATTSNSHFFSELGQRIIKAASQFGPHGRLYEVDPRLRPTGRSGALAMPLTAFVRYFREGGGPAVGAAGPVQGARHRRLARRRPQRAMAAVTDVDLLPAVAAAGRRRNPARCGGGSRNRPRRRTSSAAAGGTMDAEFIVQMLQLKHGARAAGDSRAGHARRRWPRWPRRAAWPRTTRSFSPRATASSAASRPASG